MLLRPKRRLIGKMESFAMHWHFLGKQVVCLLCQIYIHKQFLKITKRGWSHSQQLNTFYWQFSEQRTCLSDLLQGTQGSNYHSGKKKEQHPFGLLDTQWRLRKSMTTWSSWSIKIPVKTSTDALKGRVIQLKWKQWVSDTNKLSQWSWLVQRLKSYLYMGLC